jgi:DNA-binding CsgD family transcriptional regulator
LETVLVGRSEQLKAIGGAAAMARDGSCRVVSVEGPAGAGKSALVCRAVDEVVGPVRVVELGGLEYIADVPYAALAPLVDLSVEATVFEAAKAVLTRVAELADTELLVVVVEDLQWFDRASRRALAVAVSRLDREPVLVIATARGDHTGADDGWLRLRNDAGRSTRLRASELSVADVVELAAARGIRIEEGAARRLVDHTGGNALYLTTMLSEVPESVLTRPGKSLPVPRDLAALVVAQLADADPGAVSLMGALAVLDRPSPLVDLVRVAGIDDPAVTAERALATRLIDRRDGDGVPLFEFVHPLLRHAVYESLSPVRRRDLHGSAAALGDPRAALGHRFAAADQADEELAAELEHAAEDARVREGSASAARMWRWAAEVSPALDERQRRLMSGARLLVRTEDTVLDELVPAIESCADGPGKDLVLGVVAWQTGRPDESLLRLRRAADSDDGEVGIEALIQLASQFVVLLRGQEAIDAATEAIGRGIADADLERQAWAMSALGRAEVDGAVVALELLDERLSGPPSHTALADTGLLAVRGMLATFSLHANAAIADLTVVIRRGATAMPARRRAHLDLAQSLFQIGRWDEALLNARLALDLTDPEHGWLGAASHQLLAGVFAARGDWEAAGASVEAAHEVAAEFHTPEAALASRRAAIAVALARDDVDTLAELTATMRQPPMLSVLSLVHPAVVARIGTGRIDEAERLVGQLVLDAERRHLDLRCQIADLRGRIAVRRGDPVTAEAAFAEAVDGFRADTPVLVAAGVRTERGRLLRNLGKRQDAIGQFRSAHKLLEQVGAVPYLERLDVDLADSGLSRASNRRDRSPLELTPREQDVVTLALDMRSNQEIADQLFVSKKAVEYHLSNIYGKLGVRSRRGLRERLGLGT